LAKSAYFITHAVNAALYFASPGLRSWQRPHRLRPRTMFGVVEQVLGRLRVTAPAD
jgi:hypothetical protein